MDYEGADLLYSRGTSPMKGIVMETCSRMRRKVAGIALAVGTALTLVACSSDPAAPGASSTSPSGRVEAEITIQTAPTLSGANIFLGVDEGIFTKHGLTVKANSTGTQGDAVPQILSGNLNYAFTDVATLVSATRQDIGLVAVGPGTVGNGADRGINGVVGKPSITRFRDLEGKNVQVSVIGGTSQLLVTADVAMDGGDPSKINFVEIPSPQAVAALQSGSVDAIVTADPNVTAALDLGFKYVGNLDKAAVGLPLFVFVTSKAYAEANPQAVRQFSDALREANVFTNANPDKARAATVAHTTANPALLNRAAMPLYGEQSLTTAQLQSYLDLMVKYGGLNKSDAPDPGAALWSGL